jgi:hypothetical protein
MCGRFSEDFGYLCWECFSELVGLGVQTDIDEFMHDPKRATINEEASLVYFDKLFPSQEF